MSVQEILADTDTRMGKATEALKRELATIRTGRASPALLDKLRVDYYGVPTPISQMANIATPEARLLVIQPWDRSQMGPIEKAILKSDLGLTPTNDGNTIRLSIPPLTEERRHELVKLVRKRVENGRISLRNIRRDAQEAIRALERQKAISQDEMARARDQLQKLTDAFVEQANTIGQEKEAEVLEV
jgi:ribosome recycling factor